MKQKSHYFICTLLQPILRDENRHIFNENKKWECKKRLEEVQKSSGLGVRMKIRYINRRPTFQNMLKISEVVRSNISKQCQ